MLSIGFLSFFFKSEVVFEKWLCIGEKTKKLSNFTRKKPEEANDMIYSPERSFEYWDHLQSLKSPGFEIHRRLSDSFGRTCSLSPRGLLMP